MNTTHLFGTGYPALACEHFWLEFYHGETEISFQEEGETIRALDGSIHKFIDGYRGIIRLSLLNVLEDADNGFFLELIRMLNYHRSSAAPIWVIPHMDGYTPRNYECKLPEKYDIKELGKVAAGQKIELIFETTRLLKNIPAYVNSSQPLPFYLFNGQTLSLWDGSELEYNY